MKGLTIIQTMEVSGAKFKLHFNPFSFIGAVCVGAVTGGPFGIGLAVGAHLIAQASGNLNDLANQEGTIYEITTTYIINISQHVGIG
jgi:hypothetical protein